MTGRQFREDLRRVINEHSQESASNTPDFILARFLQQCLEAFDSAIQRRTTWYENDDEAGQ